TELNSPEYSPNDSPESFSPSFTTKPRRGGAYRPIHSPEYSPEYSPELFNQKFTFIFTHSPLYK
ncbi:TPA: hypothetical protein ACH7KW_005045, partial [Escherichia coli]